jgi:polar amino acid transport system substrate-binding protein
MNLGKNISRRVLASAFAISALVVSGIAAAEDVPNFDPSTIETDSALAAKLPERIKKAGVLTVGSDTAYAPWEYISEADGKTVEGIDVDLGEAIAKTLGVKIDFQTSAFDAILPALGSKYDVGISAFSITNERMGAVNFVSYSQSGSLWAIKSGNPGGFDPANICGHSIAIQSGSYEEGLVKKEGEACVAAGKPVINFLPFATQTEALTRIAAGGADATVSGSSTIGYAAKQSGGKLATMKPIGPLGGTGLNGIAISKKDTELTALIAETVNKLINDGTFGKIYDMWGVNDSFIAVAEVNPKVAD